MTGLAAFVATVLSLAGIAFTGWYLTFREDRRRFELGRAPGVSVDDVEELRAAVEKLRSQVGALQARAIGR